MSEGPHFSQVCGGGDDARLDVLFVHGLSGDPFGTWSSGAEEEFWPKWLCEEVKGVSIYALGYPAGIFEKWAKKEMDIHERASNMLEYLAAHDVGIRPMAMVCHSLGGILAKEMIRTSKDCSDDSWKRIADKTKLVVFMGTPHTGAGLASAVKLFIPRIASKYVDLLSDDSGYLTSLNQFYRDYAYKSGVSTVAYYEKFKTKNAAFVVPRGSADPGVAGTRPVPVDADHISICKPSGRTDLVYTSLCRHLRGALKHCPVVPPPDGVSDSFAPEDYSVGVDSDRRDLLQKLIEAGREHEYPKANDLQNKFAQRYYKLGLHTEAKSASDAILSSVEQRFFTHVYSAKICKGATDDEIASALQAHVIDPLCGGRDGHALGHAAVLQALYFLTEQCYIQWDAP